MTRKGHSAPPKLLGCLHHSRDDDLEKQNCASSVGSVDWSKARGPALAETHGPVPFCL